MLSQKFSTRLIGFLALMLLSAGCAPAKPVTTDQDQFRNRRWLRILVELKAESILADTPAIATGSARRAVDKWLDEMPGQGRGRPPEDFDDLMAAWLRRGKMLSAVDDVLIKILRDPRSFRRRAAAAVIGKIAGAKSLDALESVFATDDVQLHFCALESLEAIDSPRRISVLTTALKSTYRHPVSKDEGSPTSEAQVRANIAILLSEIKSAEATKLLEELISKERDPYVREIVKEFHDARKLGPSR